MTCKLLATVIWSHFHWDHIGNMALFPASTEIVVGPGFKSAPQLLPGFPEKLDSPVLVSDFKGRELREIDFTGSNLRIGGYRAYDFFGDGSFYLLGTSPLSPEPRFSRSEAMLMSQTALCRHAWSLYRAYVRTCTHNLSRR
jgi:hypothetical protein